MTLPPQGHPQHELRRRIADCRERLRRARTGHREAEHDTAAHAGQDEPTPAEADDAPQKGSSVVRRQLSVFSLA